MSIYEPCQELKPEESERGGDPAIWISKRRDLLDWFRREAPSLASAYEAAVLLIDMPAFPARVHLVCHVVRDIYSKLPEILDGEFRRTNAGEVYRSSVDEVEAHWKSSSRSLLQPDGSPASALKTADKVVVLAAAAKSVDNLLEKHRALKDQPRSAEVLVRALYRRFAESGLNPPARLAQAFEDERRWFMQRAHLVIDTTKVPTDVGLVKHFTSFERALYSLVGQYFSGKKEIDAIIEQANQRAG